MPKSNGYILDTPLQTWSTAGGNATHSLLTDEIEHATMKHSLHGARPEHRVYGEHRSNRWIIVQNTRGLQQSSALQPALGSLTAAGYVPTVLEAGNKTLIVGQKK